MNKTLSIGLAGFSFTIEEHAYIKLSDYLTALRNSLDATEADEVMNDIEIRMVEIFKEALGKREVINDDDVEKVIAQIGSPEKIEEQEEAYFSEKPKAKYQKEQHSGTNYKQLFRDPERQKIAGVCAGLANYFGLDVTIMRVIWVLAFFALIPLPGSPGILILLYGILWLVLPKARTASDFLKMKGKPVNFDNLKEESNKIVQFANASGQRVNEFYTENKPYIHNAGNSLWNAFRYILGGFFGLLGIGCLVGSAAIFGSTWMVDGDLNIPGNMGFFLQDNNLKVLALSFAFLSTFIPAIIFFLLAIKLFSPKTKLNYTGYVIGALVFIWIALLAAIGFTAAKYKAQYSGNNEEAENIAVIAPNDTILVDLKKVNIPTNFKSYWDDVYSDSKTVYKEDYPRLHVTRKDVKEPYLIVKKEADGYNLPLRMNVPVEITDNKLSLPNYFSYPYEYRMRDYDVSYELVVPKNMVVKKLNDNGGFSVSDDIEDQRDYNKNDNNGNNISIEKDKIKINKSTIEYNSAEPDSVIINGKKYPKEEANKIIERDVAKLKDLDALKDVNISIKDGKKEISIKTK